MCREASARRRSRRSEGTRARRARISKVPRHERGARFFDRFGIPSFSERRVTHRLSRPLSAQCFLAGRRGVRRRRSARGVGALHQVGGEHVPLGRARDGGSPSARAVHARAAGGSAIQGRRAIPPRLGQVRGLLQGPARYLQVPRGERYRPAPRPVLRGVRRVPRDSRRVRAGARGVRSRRDDARPASRASQGQARAVPAQDDAPQAARARGRHRRRRRGGGPGRRPRASVRHPPRRRVSPRRRRREQRRLRARRRRRRRRNLARARHARDRLRRRRRDVLR